MDKTMKDRIDGLVRTRALFDFHVATKALFRNIRHDDEFSCLSKNEIHDYMRARLDQAMTEAEVEGPLTAKDYPLMINAVAYVRRHGPFDKSARAIAAGLYDLDDEGLAILDRMVSGVKDTCG